MESSEMSCVGSGCPWIQYGDPGQRRSQDILQEGGIHLWIGWYLLFITFLRIQHASQNQSSADMFS